MGSELEWVLLGLAVRLVLVRFLLSPRAFYRIALSD